MLIVDAIVLIFGNTRVSPRPSQSETCSLTMNTDHQDRVIQIWQAIAKHYKENTWVAGYNKLNEPADPDHINLQAFYDRIFPAIREIDSDHILFPDGNTYVCVKSVGFFVMFFQLISCVVHGFYCFQESLSQHSLLYPRL